MRWPGTASSPAGDPVDPDAEWETGLHAAVGNGDLAMVELLLELGADVEIRDTRFGGTPLDWATRFGRAEVVAVLREVSDRSG